MQHREFDKDIHCIGLYVVWPLENVQRYQNIPQSAAGAEMQKYKTTKKKALLPPCQCKMKRCFEKLDE